MFDISFFEMSIYEIAVTTIYIIASINNIENKK